ncbi:permease prefix domain 1-containing protein [Spirillospora sp. CA-294931]|uniref:permease prefix domain 1-containing protein n=1 Tax=Spirillospora sp. CA-294931 TaxID=3240042 RepID=UPI003D8BEF72
MVSSEVHAGQSARGGEPQAVDQYLKAMRRTLRGPGGAKSDILKELRDGLEDMVEAYEESGLERQEAEREVIAEFGTVGELAPELQAELTYAQGRRTGWLLSFLIILQALIAQFVWQQDPKAAWPEFNPGDGYLLLASSLDWFQYGSLAVGAISIVAFGWGGRRAPVRPAMVWAIGLFAVIVLVLKSVAAFLLVALVPGMLEKSMDAAGIAQQLIVWVIPTCYVIGSAWCCLRLMPLRSPLKSR